MPRRRPHPRRIRARALRFRILGIDPDAGRSDLALGVGRARLDRVELGARFVGQLGRAGKLDRALPILRLLIDQLAESLLCFSSLRRNSTFLGLKDPSLRRSTLKNPVKSMA